MADVTPVVPTLSADSYLRDPVRIIAYVLNFYFSAPRSAMVTWFTESISFKRTLATWNDTAPNMLTEVVTRELTTTFARIFGTQPQVTVRLDAAGDDVNYTLHIDVAVLVDGTPYALGRSVILTNDGHLSYTLNDPEAGDLRP